MSYSVDTSTLIESIQDTMPLTWTTNIRSPLETSTWSSMLEMDPEAQRSQSPVMANGPSLSQLSNEPASLHTPIGLKNLMDTNISSLGSLQPKVIQPSTTGCSTWTDPSDYMLPGPMTSCTHPSIVLGTSSLNTSSHDIRTQNRQWPNDNDMGPQMIRQSACDGTTSTAHQTLAGTDTSATSVQVGTNRKIAKWTRQPAEKEVFNERWKHPR